MLVLSRGEGEEIIIGGNIVVTIVRLKGGVVKVGIDAPRDIAVHRREVQDQIDKGETK